MAIFRRIIAPHDLSRPASRALRLALELADRHGGRVLALHVIPPFEPRSEKRPGWRSAREEMLPRERRRLETAVRKIAGPGASRVVCRVVGGDAVERILEAARRADSIVMATTGRTGLARVLLGSVAESVVRGARVPVLLVRARGSGAAGRGAGHGRKPRAASARSTTPLHPMERR